MFTKRYRSYLESPEWQARRQAYFKKYGKACRVCGATRNVQLDHLDYSRLGHEELTDLLALCHDHHVEITLVRRQRRAKPGAGYRQLTAEYFGITLTSDPRPMKIIYINTVTKKRTVKKVASKQVKAARAKTRASWAAAKAAHRKAPP